MRTTALVWLLFAPFCASHGQSTSAGAPAQSARSAIFLFGPAGAEAARQAARTAVAVSRHWLSQPGSAAELRRSGSVDALPLDAKIPAKSIEPAFLNAAREARDTDRSEEHTSELQSLRHLVCRLLLEKKQTNIVEGVISALTASPMAGLDRKTHC